jgi:hypothetical protein
MSYRNVSSLREDEQKDRSYGYQLESEIEREGEPCEALPEGVRYVADTRRQSVNPEHFLKANVEDTRCNVRTRGYLPIENYGIIGNMRTIALVGTDASLDFYCYPKFDSPSIFCRMLDKDIGGHFSISPRTPHTSNKQMYLPNSNILATRFLSDEGVAEIIDYMPVPAQGQRMSTKPLLPWLIRKARVIRGSVDFNMECYPAFNYAWDTHTTEIVTEQASEDQKNIVGLEATMYPKEELHYYAGNDRVIFKSKDLSMDLRFLVKCGDFDCPLVKLHTDKAHDKHKGPGVWTEFDLQETQEVIFVFREIPSTETAKKREEETVVDRRLRMASDPPLTMSLLDALFRQTSTYWLNWVTQSTYSGRWREYVLRSALTLKLLTYEPVSKNKRLSRYLDNNLLMHFLFYRLAPLLQHLLLVFLKVCNKRKPSSKRFINFVSYTAIGGPRNWDYRYVWVRDSSFTIYAFLRLGFTREAGEYMKYIEDRCSDLV